MKISKILEMYDFYIKNKSIFKTSKEFNVCTKYLAKWFKENNLDYPKNNNKLLLYNQFYFDKINTEAKAYLLGFFFADGCLSYRQRTRKGTAVYTEKSFRINIVEEDKEILEMYKKEMEYSGDLKIKKSQEFISTNKKSYTRKSQVSLQINSKELCETLEKYGLGNRKTYSDMEIPDLCEELLHHFIRGYFDGDGCSYLSRYNNSCSFVSKRRSFLDSLNEKLFYNGISSIIRLDKTRDVYTLVLNNKKNIAKFFKYIYKDANFFLNRKYIKFRNALYKSGELLENQEIDNQQPS